jgi:hypothetical protein
VVEHRDHLMGEEVASSTPHAPCRPPSREAARPTLRRLVEIPSATLSQPAPNGPLVAARELLRNPPDAAAPPDMLRQWRDDVDRLLILAQFTPGSVGGSTSRQRRRQGGAFGLVHSPSVRSASTEDLRRAQPQTCGGGCPRFYRAGSHAPAQH